MVATPDQVMKLYMNKLTPYEHHEIFNYPQIYFIGANAKKRPGIIGGPSNCGYDDEQVRRIFLLKNKDLCYQLKCVKWRLEPEIIYVLKNVPAMFSFFIREIVQGLQLTISSDEREP